AVVIAIVRVAPPLLTLPLLLYDALPISHIGPVLVFVPVMPVIALGRGPVPGLTFSILEVVRAVFIILFLILLCLIGEELVGRVERPGSGDRKSTRLNSSHVKISYAVFCLKKKKQQ